MPNNITKSTIISDTMRNIKYHDRYSMEDMILDQCMLCCIVLGATTRSNIYTVIDNSDEGQHLLYIVDKYPVIKKKTSITDPTSLRYCIKNGPIETNRRRVSMAANRSSTQETIASYWEVRTNSTNETRHQGSTRVGTLPANGLYRCTMTP